ncbi:SDR family NAD(P)-dependent oxidoreductase [Wenzhouxiangella sp. XN79A]|uniref:NAD(P)-dependent oxidoreductase n=1 Tax=Wenzhouxiangella sp. XN79A TaxID=2724193 RepID=UPI00144A926C|nr:NAD(P)-binding oxidoreductase [Wenzhouxiangella sp. XN79A]NKI34181.1 SDR family NAD(P)-dependent oxidoreductase [Wenzhouxiangella sp. XN79A]
MAHVLVIGGSSGIGLETVKRALDKGHRVRAFARSASGIVLDDSKLEKFDGDALDASSVKRALDGVDAVVVALGIKLGPGTVLGGTDLFSKATDILLPAMEASGVDRLLVVTGYGAGDSGKAMNPINRLGFNAVFARIYADKSKQETMIKASSMKWTIARPVVLTGGSSVDYTVRTEPEDFRMGIISRASVADFLVSSIEESSYLHEAPVLN